MGNCLALCNKSLMSSSDQFSLSGTEKSKCAVTSRIHRNPLDHEETETCIRNKTELQKIERKIGLEKTSSKDSELCKIVQKELEALQQQIQRSQSVLSSLKFSTEGVICSLSNSLNKCTQTSHEIQTKDNNLA